ncbi:IMPACT family protein [Maricurvus nonylphenolicus]|uniref:YigZ family protein n=1 Tax=Maricurvus nonylphenolicus TaxID=1008307 RepID=UPI0036F330F0
MSYPIPAAICKTEYEIKKSRFIAWAAYAPDREAAMQLLSQAKSEYPDARHHCWAYLLGNPASAASAAMSDDGEPSGTAGKPILNVLQHKGVGDVMLVVIRYFGGIKLGAGGLVRAYSSAAQQVMEQLEIQQRVAMAEFTICCDFSQEQFLRHWLDQVQGQVIDIGYSHQVQVVISVPESEAGGLPDVASERGWNLLIAE